MHHNLFISSIKSNSTKMSDYIPQEVLVNILSRLPVKSLLQFRSVSKPWCALIDTSYFANLHLNQSMKTNKILTFIKGFSFLTSFYFLNLNSGPIFVKLETPFDSIGFFPDVLASCNGLICLSRGEDNREILLWNPSTRKYRLIEPPVNYPPGFGDTFTVDRLGYDHVNDDYKVVKLSQFSGRDQTSIDSEIMVYSLRTNLWELVEINFPYYACPMSCTGHGVCLGGAIHWVVTETISDMNYLIVAFDLASQTLQLVPEPKYSDNYVAKDLGVLGGCLCVIGNHEMYNVDVWLMGEYGVKESWSKLIALTMSDVKMNLLPCVRPLIYLNNGKEVLLELGHEWFVRYDVVNKKSRHLRFGDATYLSTFVYHESLV